MHSAFAALHPTNLPHRQFIICGNVSKRGKKTGHCAGFLLLNQLDVSTPF